MDRLDRTLLRLNHNGRHAATADKELKNQTTEILRGVREEGREYVVTFNGRPVAVLLPIAADFLAGEQRRAVEDAFPSAQLVSELRAATPVVF